MVTLTRPNKIKSSFTIRSDIYDRFKHVKNKSSVVNEALSLFFERRDYLKKAEEAYWDEKIKAGLLDIEAGDIVEINPHGEAVDTQSLHQKLWA